MESVYDSCMRTYVNNGFRERGQKRHSYAEQEKKTVERKMMCMRPCVHVSG